MPETVTQLLGKVREGNAAAQAELVGLLYPELRRLASRYMRQERSAHTLQPTALVNEAYIRLLGDEAPSWQNRAHFLGQAANTMRRVLVDYARKRRAGKRGGQNFIVSLHELTSDLGDSLDPESGRAGCSIEELLGIDEALTALAAIDPRQAQVIELRFFCGLSESEIAQALGISERTVRRAHSVGMLWLRRWMSKGG